MVHSTSLSCHCKLIKSPLSDSAITITIKVNVLQLSTMDDRGYISSAPTYNDKRATHTVEEIHFLPVNTYSDAVTLCTHLKVGKRSSDQEKSELFI